MSKELRNELTEALKIQVINPAVENDVDMDNIIRIMAAFSIGSSQRIKLAWNDNTTTPGYDCKVLVEYIDHNGKRDIMLDLYNADRNHLDSELDWESMDNSPVMVHRIPSKVNH